MNPRMNPLLLLELAKVWKQEANHPEAMPGDVDATAAAEARAAREAKRECANGLEMLVGLFSARHRTR